MFVFCAASKPQEKIADMKREQEHFVSHNTPSKHTKNTNTLPHNNNNNPSVRDSATRLILREKFCQLMCRFACTVAEPTELQTTEDARCIKRAHLTLRFWKQNRAAFFSSSQVKLSTGAGIWWCRRAKGAEATVREVNLHPCLSWRWAQG